jgi:hypothetical protein
LTWRLGREAEGRRSNALDARQGELPYARLASIPETGHTSCNRYHVPSWLKAKAKPKLKTTATSGAAVVSPDDIRTLGAGLEAAWEAGDAFREQGRGAEARAANERTGRSRIKLWPGRSAISRASASKPAPRFGRLRYPARPRSPRRRDIKAHAAKFYDIF